MAGAADTAKLIASLILDDKMSKGLSTAERNLGKFESTAFRVGQRVGKGFQAAASNIAKLGAIAGTAAIAGIFKSIDAASDLAETQNKVTVVFGKASEEVLAFGKASATTLGQSENAALAAAATYGNLFVSMGLTQDKSKEMSLSLVTLAADLASFNNLDPSVVFDKLRAGLTGESEPLKTLGININETIIKQKAFELGLTKTTKETLPAAIKAQAAYALIFEQSATAQGDFNRTSAGLANQQRILRAQLDNTAATIGTALLPGVTKVVTKINELVTKNQPAIAEFAKSLPAAFDAVFAFAERIPFEQIGASLQIAGMGAKAILDAFLAMPPWIQTAVITGWGLNKLTGGALSGIIGELGKGLIKGVLGINAGVVNVNGPVAGIPGTTAGKFGFLGNALKVTVIGAVAIAGLELATALSGINDPRHQLTGGGTNRFGGTTFRGTNVVSEQIANLERGLVNLEERAAKGDKVAEQQLADVKRELERLRGEQTRGNDIARFMASASKDDGIVLNGIKTSIPAAVVAMQHALHADLQAAIGAIKTSNDPAAIATAIDAALKAVRGGAGSGATTSGLIGNLKEQLIAAEASGNTGLAAKIKSAIGQLEPFAKGRQWQKEQIDKAREIVASTKSAEQKTADLKGIQQDLLSHQRSMAADIVGALLDVVTAVKNIKINTFTGSPQQGPTHVPGTGPLRGEGSSGSSLPTVNPSTGFVINANFPISTRDVRDALTIRGRAGPTATEAGSA